jgi:hypothetical protein
MTTVKSILLLITCWGGGFVLGWEIGKIIEAAIL